MESIWGIVRKILSAKFVRKTGSLFAVEVFLLLVSTFSVMVNVPLVNGSGTVYIRADGSIDPSTAPISSVDYVTYALTGNVYDSIVVERDNIVIDGAGYMVQSDLSGIGIDLSYRSNVTIKNTNINRFNYGIWLYDSSNNCITQNNITGNRWHGLRLYISSNNNISENNITKNEWYGVNLCGASNNHITQNNIIDNFNGAYLSSSSNNNISGNNITKNWQIGVRFSSSSDNRLVENHVANHYWAITFDGSSNNNDIVENNITENRWDGIYLLDSSSNSIVRNNITTNHWGIRLQESYNGSIVENNIANNTNGIWLWHSSNNNAYHNNFVSNNLQVYDCSWDDPSVGSSTNDWDDGYPSGGNYWSDFEERYPDIEDIYDGPYQNESGSDGIWDGSYVIDANNRDNYPLVEPLLPEDVTPPTVTVISPENRAYAATDVTLTFIVNEAISWIGYSLDGGANTTIAENVTFTVAEGTYSIVVYANDTAGNMGSSHIVHFLVDVTSPNITDVSQFPSKNSVLAEDEVKVNATVTDNLSEVKQAILNYTTNNGTWFTVEMLNVEGDIWSATIPAFPYDTNVTYVVIAEDNASNTITTEDLGYTCQYQIIPELQSLIIPLFIIGTLLEVLAYRRRRIDSR